MTSIDSKDRSIVSSTNKGTSVIHGPVSPSEFMGPQNKEKAEERLKLAGDLWVLSAKGTTKIKLSDMNEPKKVEHKGLYISTGKGTGRIRI